MTNEQTTTVAPIVDPAGKTALVTGAAGFIGSHVAAQCRDLGMKVVAMDDMSGGFESNIPEGVEFVKGDCQDALLLQELFSKHKFTYVYHIAAYAAEGLSHFVRSYNYRVNLLASVELLNMAVKHKVNCFIFTSSIAVYGSAGDNLGEGIDEKVCDENLTPAPEDPYGISKYAFEMDLKAAKQLFGLDYVVFRPHNVYGPHQNMYDKYRNVVGIFINQIFHDRPLTVFGDGEQTRAFSYIDDVAPVIAKGPLVEKARNEIFNVGADTPYTVNVLANEIKTALDKPDHKINHEPPRHEVVNAVSNHDKVKKFYGTAKAEDLSVGLKKTIDWYTTQGTVFKPVEFESVEILEKMPPSWVRPDLKQSVICSGTRAGTVGDESSKVVPELSTEAEPVARQESDAKRQKVGEVA